MTRNNYFTKLKKITVAVLSVMLILCASLFLLTACNDKYTAKDPTYSYTSEDETVDALFNYSFDDGMKDKALSDFPVSSPKGWTQAVDNSAASSAVSSGVVNVSEESWKALLKTLLDDVDFLAYLNNSKDVKQKTADSLSDPSVNKDNVSLTQIKNYVEANFATIFNTPGKRTAVGSETVDDFVYMINNYRDNANYKRGTAQKLTASKSITLEKGKTYLFSAWIKTANLLSNNSEAGANIRLGNTLNSSSQAVYSINGIKDTEWTKYQIYVKANDFYAQTVTPIFGLGYGNGNNSLGADYVEGSLFIDDVKFEEVENTLFPTSSDKVVYNAEKITATPINATTYAYDLNPDTTSYFTDITSASANGYTESNIDNGDDIIATDCTNPYIEENESIKINLDKPTSYTVELLEQTVSGKEYFYLTFDIENKLNKFGSTSITIDVFDIYNGVSVKRPAVATFSDVNKDGATTHCGIMIKNNFEGTSRDFKVNLVIGPTDVANVKLASDLATGEVIFSNIKYATGKAYRYTDDTNTVETENYSLYDLFNSTANATVALYAGYNSDYSESTEAGESYNISIAPGNIGSIVTEPTNANGYYGVTANHIYITSNTDGNGNLVDQTNTRSGLGNTSGVAGLINSKYLSEYDNNLSLNVSSALSGAIKEGKNIQPLMIYNADGSSYGFVGDSKTISASAYAQVSVTLRVVDKDNSNKASAYVYLTDTKDISKSVLTFADFDEYKGSDRPLTFKVTSADLNDDGWTTVTFYIATGSTAKNFRVEVWNGQRDGESASYGYVFVKSIVVSTTSAFTEPETKDATFSTPGNPLFDITREGFMGDNDELIAYTRKLTTKEEQFNNEYPDSKVSYKSKYVWAKNSNTIYAVYNTIDAVEVDPYANITDDDKGSGCQSNADPSTFWMSFSSILLAAVLILALIALVIKRISFRRKANRSDAKSKYQVQSRITTHRNNEEIKAKKQRELEEKKKAEQKAVKEEKVEEPKEEVVEETETNETTEQAEDSYVYGEVQDFGETTEETPVEETTENTETSNEEKPE